MLVKEWNPVWALAALVATIAVGFSFFDGPHCYEKQCAHIRQHQESAVDNNSPPVFTSVGNWAANNHDAIEALSAIASLILAAGLVGFTFTLYCATAKTADLTNQALRLGRDEFDATHRPKIVIQHVMLSDKGGRGSEHGRIDFMVANAGETKATIKRFSAYGYGQPSDAAFMPGFREITPQEPKDLALAAGARCLICAECRSVEFEWDTFVAGDGRFFVVGRVEYIGNDGIERVSGFCREYLKSTGMWDRVNNSEYEYAY